MSKFGSNGMQNDDDFYGDQEVTTEGEVARRNREVEALRRQHYNTGIREGASEASDATLQGGFDKGFADGARVTAEPGFILGACSVLDAFYAKNEPSLADLNLNEQDKVEALQKDLSTIRESTAQLRAWLRASAVRSTTDVQKLRQVCEQAVSLEVPDYPPTETVTNPSGDLG